MNWVLIQQNILYHYLPIDTEVRVRMDQPTTGDQTVLAVLK